MFGFKQKKTSNIQANAALEQKSYLRQMAAKIRKAYKPVGGMNYGITARYVNRDAAKSYGTLYNYTTTPVLSSTAASQRETISDRAWDLYTNDAAANGIIEGLNVDIVGTGLTPIATPMTEYLGFDSKWEDEYQQVLRNLWEIWGLSPSKYCDATRRMDINQQQSWTVFSWKLEGVALWQPLMLPESNLRKFSLALQPIAAHRLRTPTDKMNEANIFDGVEVDKYGAPVKYWIQKPDAMYSTLTNTSSGNFYQIPAYNLKTGRPNIISCFATRNISDYRSESLLTSIIKTLRDRHDHVDNALVGAIVANLYTVFVKNGLATKDPDGNTINEPIQEINGGTILNGAPGEEPEVIKSDRPGPHFKDMNYSTIEELGMATGRGFEKTLRKWEASYSASRMSLLQALKVDRMDQHTLISGFLAPVRALITEEAALRGYIKIKDIFHFYENVYAYTKAEWLPPPVGDVDQKKANDADALALKNGDKTYQDICAERGKWWKDVRRQRAKELAYDKQLEQEFGIEFNKTKAEIKPDNLKEEGDNDNDSDNDSEKGGDK